jgi:hypothetical protein
LETALPHTASADNLVDTIDESVEQANTRFLPFKAFVFASSIGAVLGAFVLGAWLVRVLWNVVEGGPWPIGSQVSFGGATVAFIVLAFAAANVFLRIIDCSALEVELPPALQGLRRAYPRALGFVGGAIALAIGAIIGVTIFR